MGAQLKYQPPTKHIAVASYQESRKRNSEEQITRRALQSWEHLTTAFHPPARARARSLHCKHLIFNSLSGGHGIHSLNLYSSNYSGLTEMRIISTRARSVVESRMGFIQLYGSVFKQRLNTVLISPIFHRSTRRKYCTCMTKQAGQEPPPVR